MHLNPLLLELLFPWLRGANLRLTDATTAISIPDSTAEFILELVEETLRKVMYVWLYLYIDYNTYQQLSVCTSEQDQFNWFKTKLAKIFLSQPR